MIVMVFFASSCRTVKQSSDIMPPVIITNSDSVSMETVINTTYTPEEVGFDIPKQSEVKTTKGDSSHVETDMAESDAWINDDGTLGHSIRNKEGQIKSTVHVPHTTATTNKVAVKEKEIPVPQPYPVEVEREFTVMEQFKLAVFWNLVCAVAVSLIIMFRKPLLTIFRKIIRL